MSEPPSHFMAVCPNCLMGLKVPLEYGGSNVRCKHCEHKFRALVPDQSMTPASAEFLTPTLSNSASAEKRLTLVCPSCSTSLSARSALAGHHVRCKHCGQKFLVPRFDGPGTRLEALQDEHAAIQPEKESGTSQLEQPLDDHQRLRSDPEYAQGNECNGRLVEPKQTVETSHTGADELLEQPRHLSSLQAQSDRDARIRAEEQYNLSRSELESTRSEISMLQTRLREALELQDKLKADHLEAIRSERSRLETEFRAEIEAQRLRYTEQFEEIQARSEANAQLVEQLKAEIMTIAQTIRTQYRP